MKEGSAKIKKAIQDLEELVRIVGEDTGAFVMPDSDEDSVGYTLEGELEMTFGHVRRARSALDILERCFPQEASHAD